MRRFARVVALPDLKNVFSSSQINSLEVPTEPSLAGVGQNPARSGGAYHVSIERRGLKIRSEAQPDKSHRANSGLTIHKCDRRMTKRLG